MDKYSTHLLRHYRSRIGRNLQEARHHKQLTLKRLSMQTGLSERLLEQYELGKNDIQLREMLKLACALNMTMDRLIG